MHEVLVNRLGGLSLPRKSVVRLTDRPDMTLDVYRGRKTTVQQQQLLAGAGEAFRGGGRGWFPAHSSVTCTGKDEKISQPVNSYYGFIGWGVNVGSSNVHLGSFRNSPNISRQSNNTIGNRAGQPQFHNACLTCCLDFRAGGFVSATAFQW